MLSVKNIFAGYGNITVLNDITFDLSKNDILGVLGRNGMGKSTLIRVLSGLIKASDGTIELLGENITESQKLGTLNLKFECLNAEQLLFSCLF